MKMKSFLTMLACVLAAATSLFAGTSTKAARHTFAIGTNDFLLDGRNFQIRCGEIHAARVPREYWRNRLQMARAMGLNTVCAYLFWNQIEPQPGKFDWSGQADVAEFCRIAQQEGLWVILRPGPYACAEWEMGGLPWWLLKDDDIKLRTSDPHFMAAATNYLHAVGNKLAPLQITRGGPILMVQVENEYGSYGKDSAYMGEMRKARARRRLRRAAVRVQSAGRFEKRLPRRFVSRREFRLRTRAKGSSRCAKFCRKAR